MHKRDIMVLLEALIVERLFGNGPWPPDRETFDALQAAFIGLGLEEEVSGQEFSGQTIHQNTPLGKELNFDLVQVFAGTFDECSAIQILERYGLMKEEEINEMLESDLLASEEEPSRVFKYRIQKAYFEYLNPSGLKN